MTGERKGSGSTTRRVMGNKKVVRRNHPATLTVLWSHTDNGQHEHARYRGHILRVDHTVALAGNDCGLCLGFIDNRYVGSGQNMPTICDKIFAMVDEIENKKGRDR